MGQGLRTERRVRRYSKQVKFFESSHKVLEKESDDVWFDDIGYVCFVVILGCPLLNRRLYVGGKVVMRITLCRSRQTRVRVRIYRSTCLPI